MDLVNLMYKYINRLINGTKLLDELKNIDLKNYNETEQKEIKKIIREVENILKTIPNEIDEVEIKRKEQIERLLNVVTKINSSDNLEKKEKWNKTYESLLKEKEITKDGGNLYKSLFKLMTRNNLVSKYAQSMDDEELLEFITKYIHVPFPPEIDQEAFDSLVNIGIKKDKRESLWRLAFNYFKKNKNFSKIVDYFIEKRDDYYIVELVCAVREDLELYEIANKVKKTNDKEFIKKCVDYAKSIKLINNNDLKKLGLEEYIKEK